MARLTGGATVHPADPALDELWASLAGGPGASGDAAWSPWALRAAGAVDLGVSVGSALAAERLAPQGTEEEASFSTKALTRWFAFRSALARGLRTHASAATSRADAPVEVYATHLTNDDYVVGAAALAASLAASGTTRPLVALVAPGVSVDGRRSLLRAGWALVDIDLVGVDGVDSLHARSYLSKVWLWALPADSVIYLDTDTLVLENLDHLFGLPLSQEGVEIAAVQDSQPHASGGAPMLQGGLLVLRPSPRHFAAMAHGCSRAGRSKARLDDFAWHDQEFLTRYFNDACSSEVVDRPAAWWRELPGRYNFCLRYPLRPLYQGVTPASAAVLHYATAKPWDPLKRYCIAPAYQWLYLLFAQAANVPWTVREVAADSARDREDQEKLTKFLAEHGQP